MISFDIKESDIDNYYNFTVYVDNTTVNYGLVGKSDLAEILVNVRTEIDVLMEEIS